MANNKFLTLNDKTLNLTQWSQLTGIPRPTISNRLSRGWSIEESLSYASNIKNSIKSKRRYGQLITSKKQQDSKNYKLNKDSYSKKAKIYYGKNKEDIKKRSKDYRAINRSKCSKRDKAYRMANSEQISKQKIDKKNQDPEKWRKESRISSRSLRWQDHQKRVNGIVYNGKVDPDKLAKWRLENRLRINAQANLRYHINKGNIVRPEICPKCGKKPILGMVMGIFDESLEINSIKWMCPMCHGELLSQKSPEILAS